MNSQTAINDETAINETARVSNPSRLHEPADPAQQPDAPQQSANSIPINDPSPCEHRFANRTRCRQLASPANPRFCPRHAALPENMQPADLTPELIKNPDDLQSLDGIYDFLTRLLVLQAQNRVSTRRAAVLAYVINQLLRTFAAIRREQASSDEPKIPCGLWRPVRD